VERSQLVFELGGTASLAGFGSRAYLDELAEEALSGRPRTRP